MLRYALVFVCIRSIWGFGYHVNIVKPGPLYPPTKGEVWPKPQNERKEPIYYSFDPGHFKVKVQQETCDILTNAVERYIYIIKNKSGLHARDRKLRAHRRTDDVYKGKINQLMITLTSPCEEYPHFDMIESYNLSVADTSQLTSTSIWGVLRGLETFSQLFYLSNDRNELYINKTDIIDFPRYKHRGILLDTSRHYATTSTILKLLESISINKMNVFHWHIVDDQSFPYQSEKFPEISERGAYDSSMVYTKEDILMIIDFARNRGIRVIPEFDVPGHTASWGLAYPGVLTECYNQQQMVGLGPMDPTKNITYKLLADLFTEVQELFPERYFHVGGDEVELNCWSSNPHLRDYMNKNNLKVSDLHSLFMRNVIPLLSNNSKVIVWQEVFDEKVPLSMDTLVQVWKNGWVTEMISVLKSGHSVLFSAAWYLDSLNQKWTDLYKQDPRGMVLDATDNSSLAEGVVGGEACMWGEMINVRSVMARVWPRACAVAERLWSSVEGSYYIVPAEAYHRIEEHTCRMIRRGIDSGPPSGPGFCVV
ncbi:beta-hexosaminidase subunit beta-like [Danaus plexippus]|uniref:beta-hexosaminidase subunit beta-like n=1 Tax=Danaus plexippus TaxID=13037 RepID=UPI002AAF223B|nr:beta-hexosaminidase subunit beta-like [Danaus plexippus]